MRRVTGRGPANLLIVLAVLLAALSAMMPWVRTPGVEALSGATGTSTAQPAMQGLAAVLAGVLAAGWLLSLTLPPRGKQVVAVLLALVGVGLVLVAFTPRADLVADLTSHSLGAEPQVTFWPWLSLPAGIVAVLGAAAVLIGAPRWPRSVDRFQRGPVASGVDSDSDPLEVWKAMDAGLDPTADPPVGKGDEERSDGPQ